MTIRRAVAMLAALFGWCAIASAQVVTLSISPQSCSGSCAPTITWSTSAFPAPNGAVSCTAGGDWSGTKAASGSELLPTVSATTAQVVRSYSLDCGQARGSATLSWDPPTTRTDGSPLTNLAGFRLRYGNATGNYPNVVNISNPGARSHVQHNLPVGPFHAVMAAYDAVGLESANSNPVNRSIVGTSASAPPVTLTVNPQAPPNPPSNVTVAAATGFQQTPVFSLTAANQRGTYFGVIDLGKPCTGPVLFRFRQRDFREVSRADVYFWGSTSARVAAPCA